MRLLLYDLQHKRHAMSMSGMPLNYLQSRPAICLLTQYVQDCRRASTNDDVVSYQVRNDSRNIHLVTVWNLASSLFVADPVHLDCTRASRARSCLILSNGGMIESLNDLFASSASRIIYAISICFRRTACRNACNSPLPILLLIPNHANPISL